MKKYITICLAALFLLSVFTEVLPGDQEAKAHKTFKTIRGVDFEPMERTKVNPYLMMPVPRPWKKHYLESKNGDKIFIVSDLNPRFALSIMFSVIPDTRSSYEDIVKKSRKADFGKEKIKNIEFIKEVDQTGADKKELLFGANIVSGNTVAAYYYFKDIKSTIKVHTNIVFVDPFEDEEWKFIIKTVLRMMLEIERYN
ncbi:MAG: hypothetical protein ACOCWZ_04025 [Spirochaetota bacterium]